MSIGPFVLAWTAWGLYWLISAARVKVTDREESGASRMTHLLPVVLGIAAFNPALGAGWLNERLLPVGPASHWTGVVLLFAGLGFACWARAILGGNWSSTVTIKSGHELIRTGPYRFVRHPIYTGLLTAFLGGAIAQGLLRSFLGFGLVTAAAVIKLSIEESMLRERFQDEYLRYRKQVAALIPGVF